MPNHVTNKVTISGAQERLSELRTLMAGTGCDGEPEVLTFHSLIPMPWYLHEIVDGSDLPYALWLTDLKAYKQYKSKESAQTAWVAKMLGIEDKPPQTIEEKFSALFRCQVSTRDEAIDWAIENKPELWGQGERVCMALREHGCKSWYDWSIENWGTKWDAYDIDVAESPGELIYVFDTAWSTPAPVIQAMANRFPDLAIEHRFFDEGHGFWGIYTYEGGLCCISDTEEHNRVELCIELKGYDPTEDEDDDEDPIFADEKAQSTHNMTEQYGQTVCVVNIIAADNNGSETLGVPASLDSSDFDDSHPSADTPVQ